MNDEAPTIDTERLTLSAHRREDFDECAAMWSDPEVTRHIGGRPFMQEENWTRLLRYIGHWKALGFGYWIVREKASGKFVGEVGFAEYKREIVPAFEGAPEGGWVLSPRAHGSGYATEAVRAALTWIDTRFSRTVCMIDSGNVASIRVAEKCGYKQWTNASYKGTPVLLFER